MLAVALPDNGSALPNVAESLDKALEGRLGRLAAEEEVAQAIGRTAVLHPNGELGARRVVAVGLGPAAEIDADALRTAAARVSAAADRVGGALAWLLDESLDLTPAEQARAIVDGLVLGAYDPGRWKQEVKELPFERLILIGPDEAAEPARRALSVAEAANRARDLANTGANELTPRSSPRVHRTSHPSASTSPPRRWGPSRSSSSAWGRSPGSHRGATTLRA